MGEAKNEVIVLGTIHSQHLTSLDYSLDELGAIIKTINPDYVFAEIPSDRFSIAMNEFKRSGIISEPRVLQYPEFSKVVIPLSSKLGFNVKPVSAWTEEMANARDEKIEEIKYNVSRNEDWQKYKNARASSAKLFAEKIDKFSPEIIHTDEFDEILNIELSVFNELFNDDLEKGGWDNINNAHYALINDELNNIKNQNKKVLIIFGAGHKGWLIKKLKTRTDIKLMPLLTAL